jgi:hypothetical protein
VGRRKQRLPEQLVSLLHALSGKMEQRPVRLSGPQVSSALYGLQVREPSITDTCVDFFLVPSSLACLIQLD